MFANVSQATDWKGKGTFYSGGKLQLQQILHFSEDFSHFLNSDFTYGNRIVFENFIWYVLLKYLRHMWMSTWVWHICNAYLPIWSTRVLPWAGERLPETAWWICFLILDIIQHHGRLHIAVDPYGFAPEQGICQICYNSGAE